MAKTFNGWDALDTYPSAEFIAPGGKHVYVANNDVAVVFAYVATRWHNEVEEIAVSHPANRVKPRERHTTIPGGGYDLIGIHCWRQPGTTVGTGDRSNHRSATGMDQNGHLHHYEASCLRGKCYGDGKPHPYVDGFTQPQRDNVRAICRSVTDEAGTVILRSGLDFAKGLRDGMHVEIEPGVQPWQVKQAADKLRALAAPVEPIHELTDPLRNALTALGYKPSIEGVRDYQSDHEAWGHDLVVDSIPGPATTAALETSMSKLDEILAAVRGNDTVNVSQGTGDMLYTGRTGRQPRDWFLNLIGNRIGRIDQRTKDHTAQLAGLAEAVAQISEIQGMDKDQVRQLVTESINEARVRLEAADAPTKED